MFEFVNWVNNVTMSIAFYSSLKQSDFDLYIWSRQDSSVFFSFQSNEQTHMFLKAETFHVHMEAIQSAIGPRLDLPFILLSVA